MDPITIGVTVGTAVVSQLTKKLMEKAADPEKVANAVNWVFSAVSNFFKVRKKEKAKDAPAPQPAEPSPPASSSDEIKDTEVEAKTTAVQASAKNSWSNWPAICEPSGSNCAFFKTMSIF